VDIKIAEQLLDEFLPALEALETKSAAVLQFLKDKGLATDDEFAPYLEQAANASNVRWLATSLRMKALLASALKTEDSPSRKPEQPPAKSDEPPQMQVGHVEKSVAGPDAQAQGAAHPEERREDDGDVSWDRAEKREPDEAKRDQSKPKTAA